jgi:signal transduction histidine kinase
MRSSRDLRHIGLGLAAFGIVAVGIVAERQRYGWADLREWAPDLLVGWTLAGLGVAALALRRPRGAGILLLFSGFAWFFGNFFELEPAWLGSAAEDLAWLFLAALVQLALAYPTGRPRTAVAAAAVVGAWAVVLAPQVDLGVGRERAVALTCFAVVAAVEWCRAPAGRRRDALRGLIALVGLVAWAIVVPRLGVAGSWSLQAIGFDAGVVAVGVWLFAGLRSPAELVGRAIELDESVGTLTGALSRLLGDPGLRVGYVLEAGGDLVDDAGGVFAPAAPLQLTTRVEGASGLGGVVVHAPETLSTESDRQAVSIAVLLAAERARLRKDLRMRGDEVARSARRLVRAGDDERARVARRIASGPGAHIASASAALARARASADSDPDLDAALARAAEQTERAGEDLVAFGGGLGVPALERGLDVAVADIVRAVPLDVRCSVETFDGPPEVAATAWFVCAEGVSNVVKHARATRLDLRVSRSESRVDVVIADDGVGGADPSGSGLVGLHDRVAALGGVLRVESAAQRGTRLAALLPIGEER